jgi:hypothetical protein
MPLVEERSGYYADYGLVAQFVKALKEGFVYSREYYGKKLQHILQPS